MVSQAALPLVAGALMLGVETAQAGASDAALHAELAAVSRLSIFFGHQSVGANVLDGVQRLASREGVALRLAELPTLQGERSGAVRFSAGSGGAEPSGTLLHGLIGTNGDPAQKIYAFGQAVDGPARGAQVALMKLCYVDFHPGTDPAALFARYRAALSALARAHPGITFVHVTAPLTTAQGGWKPLVKRLLGRETAEAQNARREAFNALLRQAYAGKEPIFDLAAVESTRPDGARELVRHDARPVPALVPAYTDDGGHLNALGQERVARALVAFLARLPMARVAP